MSAATEIPLVTIVMPAFNCEAHIAESLESVGIQTFKNFEIIVVDDGSTDGTSAVARRFCEVDSRFSLIQQANAGISAARNAAIKRARGEWVALLDADDIWLPEKLATQIDLASRDPRINLVFTNYITWDGREEWAQAYPAEKPLPDGDVTELLIFGHLFLPSTVLVRRETLVEAGLFDVEMKLTEDWDMWLRIAERGIWVKGTRQPLVRYRRWPGSHTAKNRLKSIETNIRVLEKHSRVTKRTDLLPLYQRSLASQQIYHEVMRLRLTEPKNSLEWSELAWRVWRNERRLKWLRWYLFLKWPKWLGGYFTRRYVLQKIARRWPIAK